ncbi:MAG TPA: hypothetical protein VFC51_11990 [Chloroflexota bacterium]|nr:hypothetical protein [Chloroflexota bacterium]
MQEQRSPEPLDHSAEEARPRDEEVAVEVADERERVQTLGRIRQLVPRVLGLE